MPRIPVHTVESAPEASRQELAALATSFGKILNIHGEMAHSPAVLLAYGAIERILLEHGSFDGRTREAIALAVANVDGCSYCEAAHTGGGKAVGLTHDQMVAVRRGSAEFDPKLDVLLTLAREYAANLGSVPDGTWQQAVDLGWTDEQLTELSVHVTLNMFTNYFNHFVETDLDFPEAPAL